MVYKIIQVIMKTSFYVNVYNTVNHLCFRHFNFAIRIPISDSKHFIFVN